MSDDRLLAALKRLGHEELPSATDRQIRARLETAWTTSPRAHGAPLFTVRRFAPVLAVLVIALSLGGAALGAGADSPLWDTRVALEEAGAFLRLSADDRVAYLLDLVQSRTEEAARQEAAGHPGAAAKARAASASAVVELDGNIPQIDTTLPLPSPTPTPLVASPTPSSTPSASPTASASPSTAPTQTVRPTQTPVRTATPPIETPHPVTPSPAPTFTPLPTRTVTPTSPPKQQITIVGSVKNADGTYASNACVTTSSTPPSTTSSTSCMFLTKNGSYGITVSAPVGYTITLFAYLTNPTTGQMYGGYATATTTAPTTVMPAITLTLRK